MKILVFTPTYSGKDYCMDRFMQNVSRITYKNIKHIIVTNDQSEDYAHNLRRRFPSSTVVWVGRGGSSREAITRAQEYARQVAIKEGYDYLLSLESDIFPPKDFIERLLMSGKDVISGLYFIGNEKDSISVPCATILKLDEKLGMFGTRLMVEHLEVQNFCKPGIKQVAAAGMGCTLISRPVFTKIGFMYEPDMSGHSDIFWFNQCFREKVNVYVDTKIYCTHEFSDWTKVADR